MVMARPPGIRMERVTDVPAGLGLVETAVPCFLGLCERGPLHEPVRIHSLAEFHAHFGRLDVGSHLAHAVAGFFLNGGRACLVLRVAHTRDDVASEVATHATLDLCDAAGLPTLAISATSAGKWGDAIRVSVSPTVSPVQTYLTDDARAGDTSATVKSAHGLSRGTLVRLHHDEHAVFRVLTRVDGRTLHWSPSAPLPQDFRCSAPTLVDPAGFDLHVETRGMRETFTAMHLARESPQFVERVVNGVSRLITVAAQSTATPLPDALPVAVSDVHLAGGLDGLLSVAPEDFVGADLGPGQRLGLAALAEREDLDLLVLPDLPWCAAHASGFDGPKAMELVQQAAVAQCEARRDRLAILDVPNGVAPTDALAWRRQFDSAFAAFYYPWIVPVSGGAPMPPSGHVAGIFARCDLTQGVHRAPANEPLHGVIDLAVALHPEDVTALHEAGVNPLQALGPRGLRVWGARTATDDPLYRHVNVRRTVSTIARTLHAGLQWVVFEPNTPALWATIARDVRVLLDGLWRQGWFRGTTMDEAFFVLCDGRNNPPESQAHGHVVVDVGLAPLRPAEFVTVRLIHHVDVATAPHQS